MALLSKIKPIVKAALEEDIGTGDITTNCTVPESRELSGTFIAKENGIIAGLELLPLVFKTLHPDIVVKSDYEDGANVSRGATIATVQGNGRTILSAERVALNFLQRMSGIATLTNKFVQLVKNTDVTILDTRKTVPGLRLIDKWAVKIGGGANHRIGLYDMALIKENHITAAGSITAAVNEIRKIHGTSCKIESEVKNISELREALDLPLDMIMLDNFDVGLMKEAVKLTAGKIPLEASGNVSPDTILDIAETGVDYISIGMLTHSVKALDISLIVKEVN